MAQRSFGSTVKDARKLAGLNQRDFAEKVEIDFGYLSKIERGKVPPPSEKVVLKMAEVLDLDPDELMVLASRPPSDLDEVITEGSYIPAILRRTKGLNSEDWKRIEQLIENLQSAKEEGSDLPPDRL